MHPTVGKNLPKSCYLLLYNNYAAKLEGGECCLFFLSSEVRRSGSRPQDKGVSRAKASKDAAKFPVTDALLVLYVFVTKTRKVYQQYFALHMQSMVREHFKVQPHQP